MGIDTRLHENRTEPLLRLAAQPIALLRVRRNHNKSDLTDRAVSTGRIAPHERCNAETVPLLAVRRWARREKNGNSHCRHAATIG